MANIKSQIKRNRQNEKRRVRNRVFRGEARTMVKQARVAIEAGQAEESKAAVLRALSTLDKTAQKGVIHKNNAARRKSRLMKLLATMETRKVKAAMAEPEQESVVEARTKKATGRKQAAIKEPEVKADTKKASARKRTTK